MARRRRDPGTSDLFSGLEPAPVVARFAPERVRAASLKQRLARAVSEALRGKNRSEVAAAMSKFLGTPISLAMLNAYAAQSRDTHTIPADRLIALLAITRDARPLNAALDGVGFIAIEARFEALIRRVQLQEARDALDWEIDKADDAWRRG